MSECDDVLMTHIDKVCKIGKSHLRHRHLVSNTSDNDFIFETLRHNILETARSSSRWNANYPVKFIQLEKRLQNENAFGKQTITMNQIRQIGLDITVPIKDESELKVFLKQQHAFGNLIYFEDIPNYIVLDPQWLANAFRCIISAENFQQDLLCFDEWSDFKQNGILHKCLINAIFSKQRPEMREHQEDILMIMEKFNMIIRPRVLSDANKVIDECYWYVPCKAKLKPNDIDKMFNVEDGNKSTCFCFVFSFLPPRLFNHLIVSCCRKFTTAKVTRQIALFQGIGVFNVSNDGCTKLLIAEFGGIIQLQIWEWNKNEHRSLLDVLEFIRTEIKDIITNIYKMTSSTYEEKWKCPYTRYDCIDDLHEFGKLQSGQMYFCEEHKTTHAYRDDWFKIPEVPEFKQEHLNFARLAMVVLDLLADVLYDRLQLDTQNVQNRDQYDTTKLYQEHRNLNKHKPTCGWGGNWARFPQHCIGIGDDIERIRLTRNEMLHSRTFSLDETRYLELCRIIGDLLYRFDQHNASLGKPLYSDRFNEIRKTEMTKRKIDDAVTRFKTELLRLADTDGIPHISVEKMEIHIH